MPLGNHGMIDKSFWQGRRVYITGHSGFKGSWLCMWLYELGAVVKGYSLDPPTSPSLFEEAKVVSLVESEFGDIRDLEKLIKSIRDFQPEIVIHMAAQPLVRYSYDFPVETYATNVLGTLNVLEAARSCDSVKSIVNVTTDKCYENKEWIWAYRENESIGGYDPYSSSKSCAELVTACYRKSYYEQQGVGLASARAGNVIGGGDWAPDRLVPDILRAMEKKQPLAVRNPNATRPWQHVLEPLSGYLMLAKALFENPDQYAESWNFGPDRDDEKPVSWIIDRMITFWPVTSWKIDQSESMPHEAGYLKLDISKAKSKLHWRPVWSLSETLPLIISWHQAWLSGTDIQKFSMNEIQKYMQSAEKENSNKAQRFDFR